MDAASSASAGPGRALLVGLQGADSLPDLCALEAAGWRISLVAADGHQGWELARQARPDVVVCDLDAPGVDGGDVARLLAGAEAADAIPVVLVGGRDRQAELLDGLRCGARDFLVRPFSADEFLARCRAAARVSEVLMRLASSERELALLAEQSTDLVWRCGMDGVIRYASPSALAVLGWSPEELVGLHAAELCHPDDPPALTPAFAVPTGEVSRTTSRLLKADGTYAWIETTARVGPGLDGDTEVRCTSRDVSERKALEERLRHLADHDPLTDLLNRRAFDAAVARHVAHGARYGADGALLLCDVDHFKQINDNFGHGAGDRVLVRLAAALRERLRSSDVVARLGGDEFAVLLPHGGEEEAEQVAVQLVEAVRQPVDSGLDTVSITISVGIAAFDDSIRGAEDILSRADAALFNAKRAGRDQPSLFDLVARR